MIKKYLEVDFHAEPSQIHGVRVSYSSQDGFWVATADREAKLHDTLPAAENGVLAAGIEMIREAMVKRWGEQQVPTDAAEILAKVVGMMQTGEMIMRSAARTMDECVAQRRESFTPEVRLGAEWEY